MVDQHVHMVHWIEHMYHWHMHCCIIFIHHLFTFCLRCLNKLSIDNLNVLIPQFTEIVITCSSTLHIIVQLIFDRAIGEPLLW